MLSGADPARLRTLGNLAYAAPGDVKTAFEFQQKNLIAQQWKEVPGGRVTDQYASGTFSRAGFHVSVSVGSGGNPGKVDVTLNNHGNVNLGKLPVPPAAKPSYAGPITAVFITDAPIAATVEACRAPLLAAGWQPYGAAGDTLYYKQNAILITVMVIASPKQDGKTMITLEMKPGAGGKTDASLLYQTTAEIAELDRIAASQKAAAIKMLKEKADTPAPKIAITLPAGAEGVEQNKNQIKFTVGNGKAKAAIEALRKQYLDAGWKEDLASLDQIAGTVALSKEGQSLNLTYTDTGVLPAEITVSSTGAELERSGGSEK